MDSTTLVAAVAAVLAAALVAGLVATVVVRTGGPDRSPHPRDEQQMLDAYRSISSVTLQEQSEQLLQLAAGRYQTMERTALSHWQAQGDAVARQLDRYADRLAALERQRSQESSVLQAAVDGLRRSNEEIRTEARSLSAAMRDNKVRGSWGEMQLRRVLEQTGMLAHVDFVEQVSAAGPDGRGRPDVVVRLPNGRCVVVDAKAPLDRYLEAAACEDPDRRDELLRDHARAVAGHVTALARRDYDSLVDGAVDVVVMFVPGDAFLAAAHEADPALLEHAFGRRIVLASPSTLLGFLRGIALGWREQQVAEEAATIAALGRELHERVAVFAEHLARVGTSLDRAVGSYNDAVGSLERRVLVSTRRFEDLGAGSSRAVPAVDPVDTLARTIVLPDQDSRDQDRRSASPDARLTG
jgi:DNA recombination protein RmuC